MLGSCPPNVYSSSACIASVDCIKNFFSFGTIGKSSTLMPYNPCKTCISSCINIKAGSEKYPRLLNILAPLFS
ncbi:hypothetical protein RSJ10_3977 (plasmid) [Clostridium botulinum]|nr:hypothetical protein RSJ10_3977 [Clostridium botulinum]